MRESDPIILLSTVRNKILIVRCNPQDLTQMVKGSVGEFEGLRLQYL